MKSRLIFAVASLVLLFTAAWGFSAEAPAHPVKVLFLTQSKGFQHNPVKRTPEERRRFRRYQKAETTEKTSAPAAIPGEETLSPAEIAMTQLGQQTGLFTVHCTQDAAADITRDNLKNYDIVMFYTTGNLPIKHEDLEYFLNDWLKQKGHGFMGFHSATDTYKETEPYWEMIGGTFVSHPWTGWRAVTVKVLDTENPATRPFGKEFQIRDEIYRYRHWQPEKVHVLMALDMEKCIPLLSKRQLQEYMTHKDPKEPYEVPVSWIKDWGQGKIFYTNLGHSDRTWTDKRFLQFVEGGVKWILGMEPGDATPNPELSKAENAKAKEIAERASHK